MSRFPPSNAIVTRCCDDMGVRYECINGYQMVSGDRERICNNSELIGQEPTCAFPEGRQLLSPPSIEGFCCACCTKGVFFYLKSLKLCSGVHKWVIFYPMTEQKLAKDTHTQICN